MMGTNTQAPQTHKARSGLVAIIKKEFMRFFTDKRMVVSALLLPGLMIFAFYSVMGDAMGSMFSVDEDYVPSVYAINLPDSIKVLASEADLSFEEVTPDEIDGIKEQITNKEADLLAVFPADFDESVARGLEQNANEGGVIPQVELYYNSTRPESSVPFSTLAGLLDAYRNALAPVFAVNAGEDSFDLATTEDVTGFAFAMLLPLIIIVFLITGCVTVAPESIAGEKERGTIATMLITPLARWELALGKVVSLSAIALLSGFSSFIGIILSLPRMMGGGVAIEDTGISVAIYGIGDYMMLLAVMLSTVLLFVGLIAVLSAFARTVKEANTLVMPLLIIVMVIGALGMFSQEAPTELWYYLIPIYNSVQSMVGIFSFTGAPLFAVATVAVNLVVTGLCVVALTKMFNSERIVFAR
jgi:sodium transport system permease protein